MRSIKSKVAVVILSLFVALSNVACGRDSVEKSIGKFTRAVKSARQITTAQNQYGQITDAEYAQRLRLFRSVYVSIDALGDKLVEFGEINETNKAEILVYLRDVNAGLIDLVNTGNFGIKNDKNKAEFTRWLLVASAALSSIEIAVAAAKQPVPTRDLKIEGVQ